MATVRISPTEVQVDQLIYSYGSAGQADAFEACVAAVDVSHCVVDHPPQDTRGAADDAAEKRGNTSAGTQPGTGPLQGG